MHDQPRTHFNLLAWTRALSLLVLIVPPGMMATVWGLALAGVAVAGMWLIQMLVLALAVGVVASGVALLAALAFWLSRAATFRQVLSTVCIALLGVVVNFLVAVFILSRMRY